MVMRIRVTRIDGSKIGFGYAALESVGKAFLLVLDLIIGWVLYPDADKEPLTISQKQSCSGPPLLNLHHNPFRVIQPKKHRRH
jgi:hypothetical protein